MTNHDSLHDSNQPFSPSTSPSALRVSAHAATVSPPVPPCSLHFLHLPPLAVTTTSQIKKLIGPLSVVQTTQQSPETSTEEAIETACIL